MYISGCLHKLHDRAKARNFHPFLGKEYISKRIVGIHDHMPPSCGRGKWCWQVRWMLTGPWKHAWASILLASEEEMRLDYIIGSKSGLFPLLLRLVICFPFHPAAHIWQFVQPQGLIRSKGSYFCLWCSAQSRYPTAKPCWIILRGTVF